MTPLQFTRSVRSLNRLRRIAQVLTRHGFGHIVAQLNLSRFVPVWMLRKPRPREADEVAGSLGRRFATVCTELGPTFIKLGQMLSARSDLLPEEVLMELRGLQDRVPPFPTDAAMRTIEQELGQSPSECFAWIADEPSASASIGQVYRARAEDGTALVIKVRRPDIERVIQLDMQLLHWLAQSLETIMPELAIYRPSMIVDELDQALSRELDYVNEASTTTRFCEAFADDPGIRIPKVYWDLTGRTVLTLEAVPGINVQTLLTGADADAQGIDRRLVARRLAECFLTQIFDLSTFHADPHPGNILVDAPASVALIDFGQVGNLSDEMMTEIVVVIYACVNDELELAYETFADMGAIGRNTDRRGFQRSLKLLIDKYETLPLKRIYVGTLFSEISDVMRRHDVVIPRELSLLIKALSTVGTVTASLDPDLNLLELLKPRIRRALRERFSSAHVARATTMLGWDVLNIVRRAPGQLRRALRRMSTGGWELHVRHENIERLIRELDRSGNRLAFSVVIAAIIVGSSVVFGASTDLTLFGLRVQYFGIAGYLVSGVLGLGLGWAIFRSGRLH